MKTVRVNLKTTAVNSAIRHEKRNGRDVIVVPSATLPDNIVMNRILYPSASIEAGYKTLDRTWAPLGHPMINGEYVSAMEPEAITAYGVGAWNENVRRINGRVFLDKIIDVETANSTPRGRALLEAINEQKPISTSTGLMLNLRTAEHADYDYIADSIEADHDAILLNEVPAASTAQGVGLFVNKDGSKTDVQNAEIMLDDDALESIAESLAWQIEHEAKEEKRKPLVEAIMAKLKGLLSGIDFKPEGDALSVNTQEGDDMELKEVVEALQAEVKALQTNADTQAATVKQLTTELETLKTNAAAQEAAQKSVLVDRVVKANLLGEDEAKELSVNVLTKLAAKIQEPGAAFGVFGAYVGNATDSETLTDDLPE